MIWACQVCSTQVFETIKDFILDIQDGVGISIERDPNVKETLIDFAMGKADKVPIRIMIDISADSEAPYDD